MEVKYAIVIEGSDGDSVELVCQNMDPSSGVVIALAKMQNIQQFEPPQDVVYQARVAAILADLHLITVTKIDA